MKHLAQSQQGLALVVSLVILLLLTVLAITASSTSSLQERMAFNAQENNIAFQTAESGFAWVATDTVKLKTCRLPVTVTSTNPFIQSLTHIQPVTYATDASHPSGRTTRTLVTVEFNELDSDISVTSGAPILGRYDVTSNASLEPSATTASAIAANSHALHRQGYRCLGFN